MTKLQLSLTDRETELLMQKASLLGYDVTKYAKFVLAREAEEALSAIPIFNASRTIDKLVDEAIEEDNAGLTEEWKTRTYGH